MESTVWKTAARSERRDIRPGRQDPRGQVSRARRVSINPVSVLLLVTFHGLVARGFERLGGTTPREFLGPGLTRTTDHNS
jgi:hypothetical protein